MKWLFIIVALFNIAFGAYNLYLVDESNVNNRQQGTMDKSQIVLLDELDNTPLKQVEQKEEQKVPAIEQAQAVDESKQSEQNISIVESTVLPNENEQPVDTDEPVQLMGQDSIVQAESLAVQDSAPLTEMAVEDKVVTETIADPEIATLSPIINEPKEASAASEITIPPRTAKASCFKIGPFSKDLMNEIKFLLETEYQNKLSFGIETTSAITYYRIYIPPLKNKSAIKDTLKNLDEHGLNDHYVMSIGGRKNAIALGVFKKRKAAAKVAKRAAKIGLSTTIEAISDDKSSLYQLMVIFQNNQDTDRFMDIISEKGQVSEKCDK